MQIKAEGKNQINEEKAKLDQEIQVCSEKLTKLKEEQLQYKKDLSRAIEIMQVLRDEKTIKMGALSEKDAVTLIHHCPTQHENTLYTGFTEAKLDFDPETQVCKALKKALESDWRVIRIGGGGHWWAFVRNEGQNTYTTFNDGNVYTNSSMTFNSILTRWSKPDEWKKSQLTFY